MKSRLEIWKELGLLTETPQERKLFVANSFELLLAYLEHIDDSNSNGNFQTLIFAILCRIGNETDFSINEFFSIIDEVNDLILSNDFNPDETDAFCEKYSENKIKELMKKISINHE
jgi:hypothetical protein